MEKGVGSKWGCNKGIFMEIEGKSGKISFQCFAKISHLSGLGYFCKTQYKNKFSTVLSVVSQYNVD